MAMRCLSPAQRLRLETLAKSAGFLQIGFTRLVGDSSSDVFQQWLEKHYHAGLGWIEKHLDARRAPEDFDPSLPTAVVFLAAYPNQRPSSHVARYAWGKDYHKWLKRDISRLAKTFAGEFKFSEVGKVSVDTSPFSERSLAVRAGLGGIGKNGMLIHPIYGSATLIGIWRAPFITNPKTRIAFNPCRNCHKCVQSCPTGALDGSGLLDCNKCLSYHTIENKDELPDSVSTKIKEKYFGCDRCLEACPHNKMPPLEREAYPSPRDILSLGDDELLDAIRGTPLKRAGLQGLRRNARLLLDLNHNDKRTCD